MSRDGRVRSLNGAARRLLGLGEDRGEGARCHVLLHPADLPESSCPICQAVAAGVAVRGVPLQFPDGRTQAVSLAPVFLDQELGGFVHVSQDITLRERAVADLRRSQAQLSDVLAILPCGVGEIGLDGCFTFVNQAQLDIFGLAEGQVLGQRVSAVIAPPEDRAEVERRIKWLFRDEPDPLPYLRRAVRPDGAEIFIQLDWAYKRGESGDVVGIVSIVTDITERRRTEQHIRQAARVFDSTTEGVIIADTDEKIVAVNRAFTTVTGFSEADVIGRTPRALKSGRHTSEFYREMWRAIAERGSWQGELWNTRKDGTVYPEWLNISEVRNSDNELTHYVGVFSDISDRKAAEERLDKLAHHDPLTDLPNRLRFKARTELALRQATMAGNQLAVLFLDLDRFKYVNDSLGHPAGDALLKEVSRRLLASVRAGDIVARLGGDEFTILLDPVLDAGGAEVVARKVLASLGRPFMLMGQEVFIGGSIGISLFPEHGGDVTTLLKNADSAMYLAKDQGRNNFQWYTAALTSSAMRRVALEAALRRALENEEFFLEYMPQVSIRTGEIVGVEALVRWMHPVEGRIPPGAFIPEAEASGLIRRLGAWVLREACRQAAAWLAEGVPPVVVAVNISGREIGDRELLVTVQEALAESGLEPHWLELEVTESHVMHNAEEAAAILRSLRELGVQLSIDDFGTGYSSLSYLKRLPVHKLKIDRSFLRDVPGDSENQAISRAVIALGHSLQLRVIAEGVETVEQLEFLAQESCDEAQGYLHGEPQPPDKIGQLIRDWVPVARPMAEPSS